MCSRQGDWIGHWNHDGLPARDVPPSVAGVTEECGWTIVASAYRVHLPELLAIQSITCTGLWGGQRSWSYHNIVGAAKSY
jgi:hypothetical protein